MMNGIFLQDFFKEKRAEGKAIELQSFFYEDTIIIEPEDEYRFSIGNMSYLIINEEKIITLRYLALVKSIPPLEERRKAEKELMDELREELGLL